MDLRLGPRSTTYNGFPRGLALHESLACADFRFTAKTASVAGSARNWVCSLADFGTCAFDVHASSVRYGARYSDGSGTGIQDCSRWVEGYHIRRRCPISNRGQSSLLARQENSGPMDGGIGGKFVAARTPGPIEQESASVRGLLGTEPS